MEEYILKRTDEERDVVIMALMNFSGSCSKESKKIVNKILKKLGVN